LLTINHYKDFDLVYGTEIQEQLPSSIQSTKEEIPTRVINNNHIHQFVYCKLCNKPCCIYSKYTLDEEEKIDLQLLIDNIVYNCGSPLIPEEHVFFDKVFIKQKITCRSPVEACYFSCKRIPTTIICFYCGEKDGLLVPEEELSNNLSFLRNM